MPRALIAGGGIAGMAAALALARAGWEVELFERTAVLAEVGAGLQMSPNAARVLDWLGVLEDIRGSAFRPGHAVLRDGLSGREIYRAALDEAAEARWGAPYLHVHRADLLWTLVARAEEAGVQVHLDARAERVLEGPDGITLFLEGGGRHEGDMVLAADGVRSALRAELHAREQPRFTGQVAWRGLIPAERVPEGTVAPDATVWAGPGRHLVTYYVRRGEMINFVAVEERADWAAEGWAEQGDPEALRAVFAGWRPEVTTLLEAVEHCFVWGLFDRPEQARWVEGRLALIGDAAHPMLPFMAQGAAQALEDVAVLARHLGQGGKVADALRAWEDERWARVTRVQARSRANGRLFHRTPGPLRALERSMIGSVSSFAPGLAAGQLDWLYGHDPVTGMSTR